MLHSVQADCSAGDYNENITDLQSVLQDWLSEAELGNTFDNYDVDHSGDISFDEFEDMVGLHTGHI